MSDYGYCAIIVPKLRQWQGFFIRDEPHMEKNYKLVMETTRRLLEAQSEPLVEQTGVGDFITLEDQMYGALQGALAEAYFDANQTAIGSLALALAKEYGHRYFALVAERTYAGNTTRLIDIPGVDETTPIEEVRTRVKALPEILVIEVQRAIKGDETPDGGHRRTI